MGKLLGTALPCCLSSAWGRGARDGPYVGLFLVKLSLLPLPTSQPFGGDDWEFNQSRVLNPCQFKGMEGGHGIAPARDLVPCIIMFLA
jgi:hypothetical protein